MIMICLGLLGTALVCHLIFYISKEILEEFSDLSQTEEDVFLEDKYTKGYVDGYVKARTDELQKKLRIKAEEIAFEDPYLTTEEVLEKATEEIERDRL